MLPRDRRLHTAKDFTRVWRTGLVLRGRAMLVRVSPPSSTTTKYGFVVSTAVSKKATVRNVIRRRLRDIAARLAPKPPRDIVVYATKASVNATHEQLERELTDLLSSSHAPHSYRRH